MWNNVLDYVEQRLSEKESPVMNSRNKLAGSNKTQALTERHFQTDCKT